MNIEEILKRNNDFEIWQKEVRAEIENKHKELKKQNILDIEIEEFKKLEYEQAKELYKTIEYNIDTELKEELKNELINIKENKYSILKVAHYYPIINSFNELNDIQKRGLDELLKQLYNKFIYTSSSAWYKLKISRELGQAIFNRLCEAGILEKNYKISCGCDEDTIEILSNQDYNEHVKLFDIYDRYRKKLSYTDEELEWADNFEADGNRVWGVYCMECEGKNIDSMEDLEKNASVLHKVIMKPDLTYAQK